MVHYLAVFLILCISGGSLGTTTSPQQQNTAKLKDLFHVNHKTLPFLAVLSWFLLLGKIQDGGQDGYHCWWGHRPPAAPLPIKYTSPCWEEQRLSTKGKLVSKYCNKSKTPGRGSIHPLPFPPRLYHGRGMNLRVRPRVNNHESRTNKNLTWITWENQYSSSHWEYANLFTFGGYNSSYL